MAWAWGQSSEKQRTEARSEQCRLSSTRTTRQEVEMGRETEVGSVWASDPGNAGTGTSVGHSVQMARADCFMGLGLSTFIIVRILAARPHNEVR